MYSVGELIFYGRTGVCEVKEITTLKSMGETEGRLYYILEPLYKECKISIPVDNDKIYMRPVISRKHAEELIDRIPHINTSAYYSHNLYLFGVRSISVIFIFPHPFPLLSAPSPPQASAAMADLNSRSFPKWKCPHSLCNTSPPPCG